MIAKLWGSYMPLIILIIFAFLVRLYGFSNPVADWHSWRQVDTSSVSRDFVQNGINIFYPTYHDISNVPNSKFLDNPNGYRFVEFPIYNILQTVFYNLYQGFTLEQWGRLISIFSSLFSMGFIYLLVNKYVNRNSALFSAFFFGFIPFNIYYSRTILPEPLMVTTLLGSIYFFDKWLTDSKTKRSQYLYFLLSLFLITISILLKPFTLFFTLPFIVIAFNKFGKKFILKWQLWVYLLVALFPFVAWRIWMSQFPEGIPASDWLFNGGDIRFKGSFFHWIFANRIGELILGYWGIGLLIIGLIRKFDSKTTWFIMSFLISSLLYLIVIARGNVQHDYYQILIVPTLAIFLGIGSDYIVFAKDHINKRIGYIVFGVTTFFMLMFGWYTVRDYYNINNPSIIVAGKAVDSLTPKDSLIVAPFGGDTTLLYQTNRKGWASYQDDLSVLIDKGADYLLIVNPNSKDYEIANTYKVVTSSPEFILFDLINK